MVNWKPFVSSGIGNFDLSLKGDCSFALRKNVRIFTYANAIKYSLECKPYGGEDLFFYFVHLHVP